MFKKHKKKGKKSENILKTHPSRKIYLPLYGMGLIILIIIGMIKLDGGEISSLALISSIIFILLIIKGTEIHRIYHTYIIKRDALIYINGIFNRTVQDLDLIAISDFYIKQTPLQLMLNYGDIGLKMFSRQNVVIIKNINRPTYFEKQLRNAMNKIRKLDENEEK
jgi:hypothetical protein